LNFKSFGVVNTWPSNLELTIIDVNNNAVAIGGLDSSLNLAKITLNWPIEWYKEKNGLYKATIAVGYANLHGNGVWRVILLNSKAFSFTIVDYDLSIDFNFNANDDTQQPFLPTPSPSFSLIFKPSLVLPTLTQTLPITTTILDKNVSIISEPNKEEKDKKEEVVEKEKQEEKVVIKRFELNKVSLGVYWIGHSVINDRIVLNKFKQRGFFFFF
jgi:hypothetical protein